MNTIKPVYNHGRWIVLCKKHGKRGAALAEREYICPACYPGIVAMLYVVKNGALKPIPDASARRTARKMAEQAGEVYTVEYPKNRDKIEKALDILPDDRRNWNGESLKATTEAAKRLKHVAANYARRDKRLDGGSAIVTVTRRA